MSGHASPPFPAPPSGKHGWPWTGDDSTAPLEPPTRDTGQPRVTVITPSFNQGRYLEEAIRSVLLQDHPNLEYLILDGGSTDESVAIIERYAPWITRWVSEPDAGQADAINRGFALATGDLVCWLNADDLLYQGFVARRVREFGERPTADLIYGDVEVGWGGGSRTVVRGESASFLCMLRTLRVAIPQQSAMWRRSTIERFGGLDPRWHVVLDREFFLRIVRLGRAEYIPGRGAFFRQHPSAKSVAEIAVWADELPVMYRELFEDPSLEPAAKDLERETKATVHLLCCDVLRQARDWKGAIAHLGRAIAWHPYHAVTSFTTARIAGARRRLSFGQGNPYEDGKP